MRKEIKTVILGLPVVLFLLSSVLGYAVDKYSATIGESGLLYQDSLFGTFQSSIVVISLLALVGIALTVSGKEVLSSVGKSLYLLSMVLVLFTKFVLDAVNDIPGTNFMGIGAILLLTAGIIGLLFALSLLVLPWVFESIKNSDSGEVSQKNPNDKFYNLREWKKLFVAGVITDDEYETVKDETLTKYKVKKNSKVSSIMELKNVSEENLITKADFESLKKKILG